MNVPRLARPLFPRRFPAMYPTDGTTRLQRHGMQRLWYNAIVSAVSGSFYGDFVPIYMLALGASASVVGLRASINSAAALAAPLLGAWLVERTGRRKLLVLLAPGGVSRVVLLLLALVPFVFSGRAAIVAFMVLVALQAFADTVSSPAANSLLADILPVSLRGRYLGNLMVVQNVARMAILPLAGWLVRQVGVRGGELSGYQLAWLLAALTGFWATYHYARIEEPESAEYRARTSPASVRGLLGGWQALGSDRRFLLFCVVHFVWNMGVGVAGPFFTVHMVQDLGFRVDTVAFLATVTIPVNIFALHFAGELVDSKGAQRVASAAMLLVPWLPFAWVFARTPLHVGIVEAYGFLAWAGFHVATTPLLFAISPPEQRSRYVAIFNTVNGVASMLGPLVGSWFYVRWGFTPIGLMSFAGRGLGGILFFVLLRAGWWAVGDVRAVRHGLAKT